VDEEAEDDAVVDWRIPHRMAVVGQPRGHILEISMKETSCTVKSITMNPSRVIGSEI
jgi:hypothetical protein